MTATVSDITALKNNILEVPVGVLADALQEQNESMAREEAVAEEGRVRYAAEAPGRIAAAVPDMAAVEAMLDRANGRRRVRCLSLDAVRRCILKALDDADGWYAVGGDTVANAYKYPADRTICLCAVRTDGTVRVSVGTGNAKKGSSLTNPISGLTIKARPEAFKTWADAAR